ncbi:MAG TPA: ABC transporter permease subunit [Shinella sp.]|jgi:glycine betaine/proline transport system permease protein|uniref:ABC transporter permease n=1 Tax=Shinella sp. TaxID=1870904 RepID=UPI002E0DDF92|nr:ABC transporter permease subunit [Shinella sp.]
MSEISSEDGLVREFTRQGADYYARVFARIRSHAGFTWSFNGAAALLGPIWATARNIPVLFWLALFLETLAVAQFATGFAGNLGGEQRVRAERLFKQSDERRVEAEKAKTAGESSADSMLRSADGLKVAAENAARQAEAAEARGPMLIGAGLLTLLVGKLLVGVLANPLLERRFNRWRSNRTLRHGFHMPGALLAAAFCLLAYGLVAWRVAAQAPPSWLMTAPVNREWQGLVAAMLDRALKGLSKSGEAVFSAITGLINIVLDAAASALTTMPWPVTMAMIVILAWQLAGIRVAIFTTAALAYLAVLGFWEKSLETVALLGTSAVLCLLIGIPLGIWCGRRPAVYTALRPVLDFMQTMPAFVYLIPVIALFGIGKPPGVIATLVFGTPPVVRLTALGVQGVPASIREAAEAYGATRWFLLTRVDLPLAAPSIMAGVNQTILMCLSMVVIASLIGAKGLGEDVLNALQYAAVGQGLLAGLAILFCAMIIDRIVQGKARS